MSVIRIVLFHGSKNKAKCVNMAHTHNVRGRKKNGLQLERFRKIRVCTTDRSAPNKASVLWKCIGNGLRHHPYSESVANIGSMNPVLLSEKTLNQRLGLP